MIKLYSQIEHSEIGLLQVYNRYKYEKDITILPFPLIFFLMSGNEFCRCAKSFCAGFGVRLFGCKTFVK